MQAAPDVVLKAFRKVWLWDATTARPGRVADYQSLFPGYEDVVAQEYERLSSEYPSEEDARAAGKSRVGPYRLDGFLGRGGQGAVYAATDTRDGRVVALKVLAADAGVSERRLARLRREAEAVARVDHPGICRIHEAGLDGDVPYLALHLVQGRTLAEAIGRARRENPAALATVEAAQTLEIPAGDESSAASGVQRVARFFEDAARAVHAAHEAGLVHRDVKPGNLMITPAGAPVVLDFGLARDEEEGRTFTLTGALLGTPGYMAPEQTAPGGGRIDRRVDVYALGVSLFEALTLMHPFEAPTLDAAARAGLVGDAKDLRQLDARFPKNLALIVATAMRRERDRRYVTALALAEDLRAFRLGRRIAARPPGVARRLRDWAALHPATASAAAVASVSLVAGLAVSMRHNAEMRTALDEATQAKHEMRAALDDATRANAAARAALDAATKAKRSAQAARDGSLELVQFFIGPVAKQLSGEGKAKLLEDAAAKAAALFEMIPLDEFDDEGLSTMAAAWFTLGDAYELQGKRDLQIAARGKSRAILERLSPAARSAPKNAVLSAALLCWDARREQSSGNLDAALATFLRGDAAYALLDGTEAYDVSAVHEHLVALLARGKLERRLIRPESVETLRRAKVLGDRLVVQAPDDSSVRVEAMDAAYELAVVLEHEGRLTAAREVATDIVERSRAFAAAHADKPHARAALADALFRLSDFARDGGDGERACAAAAEARDIYVKLLAEFPESKRWANFNVTAHARLVRALLSCDRVKEAADVARATHALVQVTRKAKAVETDPVGMTEVANILRICAAAYRRFGALDDARSALDDAKSMLDKAAKGVPDELFVVTGVMSQGQELAAWCADAASACAAADRAPLVARALAALAEADAAAAKGAARVGASVMFERERAFIGRLTARVKRLAGDDPGAVAALEAAVAIRDRLAVRDAAYVARLADLDALLADARGAVGTK